MIEKQMKKQNTVSVLKIFKLTPSGLVEVSSLEALEYSEKTKLSGAHPCPCRKGN